MFSSPQIVILIVIAVLGHAMAFFWHVAYKHGWKACETTIYDLPISEKQLIRELKNSIHTPMHSVFLATFLYFGYFQNRSVASFFLTTLATVVWAEIWHYASHRAFHLKALHWIHHEHHKSHLNTPFTAISFSFTEKFVFDLGLLAPLALADRIVGLNVFGVAAWFVGYLIINSFSHANFELKSRTYNRVMGQLFASTTYHSLHHSRYTGNYGLGTRVLDRVFRTEWEDYERLYDRICTDRKPLARLAEKVGP